jgi:hypothetical protein
MTMTTSSREPPRSWREKNKMTMTTLRVDHTLSLKNKVNLLQHSKAKQPRSRLILLVYKLIFDNRWSFSDFVPRNKPLGSN